MKLGAASAENSSSYPTSICRKKASVTLDYVSIGSGNSQILQHIMAERLCDICAAASIADLLVGKADSMNYGLEQRKSAHLGLLSQCQARTWCPICRLVAFTVEDFATRVPDWQQDFNDSQGDIQVKLNSKRSDEADGMERVRAKLFNKDRYPVHIEVELFGSSGTIDLARGLSPIQICAEDIPLAAREELLDEMDYEEIARWIDTCTQKHDDCWRLGTERLQRPAIAEGFWVVDTEDSCIVLVDHRTVRYVALSYVWGSNHTNYDHFSSKLRKGDKSPVPLPADLPLTITNAIHMCRRFGERYLWVDALCIDQKDVEVKMTVIASMHLIYMRATYTLIAAAGQDSAAGLPGSLPGSRTAESHISRRRPVVSLPGSDHVLTVGLPSLKQCLDTSKWKTRGWTYQEGFLATRCLIFTHDEVFFVCPTNVVRESLNAQPASTPRRFSAAQQAENATYLCAAVHTGTFSFRAMEMYINSYNSRMLSFESDRIRAFLGISSILSTRIWNGLPIFNGSLTKGLIWTSRVSILDGRAQTGNRRRQLPSFTWADWDTCVGYSDAQDLEYDENTFADISVPAESNAQELHYTGYRARFALEGGSAFQPWIWNVDSKKHPGVDAYIKSAATGVDNLRLPTGLSDTEKEKLRTEGAEFLYLATWSKYDMAAVVLLAVERFDGWVERLGICCISESSWAAACPAATTELLR